MVKKVTQCLIDIFFKLIITLFLIYFILCTFNIRFYVVPTGSMEPFIHVGSLVIINENVDYSELEEGDIIVYNQSADRKIIHRIIEIREDGITTQGDANPIQDSTVITPQNYVGKYIYGIPRVGSALESITNNNKNKLIFTGIITGMCVLDIWLDIDEQKKRTKKINREG